MRESRSFGVGKRPPTGRLSSSLVNMPNRPDAIFAVPRLAEIYDLLEGERGDLEPKPGAGRVRWLHGDATSLPELAVDLATMTANVSHVFLTDQDWSAALRGIYAALRPGGRLVFEARNPARQAWRNWNREGTFLRLDVPGLGEVQTWLDLTGREWVFIAAKPDGRP